jgi:hypothetical protein
MKCLHEKTTTGRGERNERKVYFFAVIASWSKQETFNEMCRLLTYDGEADVSSAVTPESFRAADAE